MTATATAFQDPFADFSDKELGELLYSFVHNFKTLGEINGISETSLDALYNLAYSAYRAGRFSDALKVFRFLVTFDHLEKRYWMGFAACRQMTKEYRGAIDAYAVASTLDLHDPAPLLHTAECLLALDLRDNAVGALELAVETAGEDVPYQAAAEKARAMLDITRAGDPGPGGA
ncbi:MAG: SycD/LcrH family type III secretion system chaperone [Chromatiaceae bacterium]|nr:SycD/LcrH family type III secretion system chaperone [Chromatiaceae bacterium]MCP5315859.1 SycD/LcrH family type III secretion system chaperone [Chromatiaceae bacterium]